MAEIIAFGASPDLDVMDRQALTAYLAEIRRRIAALDEREPENMSSEAYDEWSEEHEQLEDLADDILDRIEELSETGEQGKIPRLSGFSVQAYFAPRATMRVLCSRTDFASWVCTRRPSDQTAVIFAAFMV